MTDGVLFGEILAVAKDVAVVRITANGETILGVCRLPTATTNPSGLWFHDTQGKILPIIGNITQNGLIAEPIIDGTPLLVNVRGHIGGYLGISNEYPWTSWLSLTPQQTWHGRLFHTTHFMVGTLCIIVLFLCMGIRRRNIELQSPPPSGSFFWRTARRAIGGWFGFGKDSFTSLPLKHRKEDKQ